MNKTSKDGRVVFYEENHSYYLDGKTRLTSITKYVSGFKPEFEKEKISLKYAKKHGLSQKEVLESWDKKGKEACDMGTFVHKIFEDYINGNNLITREDYPKSKVALLVIEELFVKGGLVPIESEMIVYNNNFAGQIDCIAKNKEGEYFILDWKTNKEIKTENYWQAMTGKYSHLDDCNLNHYSIQLSCYKAMCTEYNIKGCYVIHLDTDGYEIYEVYEDIKFD
jgi:hypothetical protein